MVLLTNGYINEQFYNDYIERKVPKYIKQKFENIFKNDECVEYKSIGIKHEEKEYLYNELFLIDLDNDGKYLFFYMGDINTSSPYAFERCSMDRDEEEEMSREEILDLVGKYNHKDQIEKLLNEIDN